jgi:DNA-binding MurR/RpiR family transcriptional regulator
MQYLLHDQSGCCNATIFFMGESAMSQTRFNDRLTQRFDQLSASHKRLAKFFREQLWQATTLTAAELGAQLEINPSTVVRFAQALGYEGLSDLQKELQQNLAESQLRRKDTLERVSLMRDLSPNLTGSETDQERLLERVFKSELQNAERTFEQIDPKAFWEAVEAVTTADHVYVIGMRASAPLSTALVTGLRYLRPRVFGLNNQFIDLADQVISISSKDVLIAYSYSPYVANTVRLLEFARDRGVKTIAITDDLFSPAARVSDHALIVHNPLWLLSSDAGSIALTNAFLFAVVSRLGDRFEKYRDQAKEAISGMIELLAREESSDRVASATAWLERSEDPKT